jgi:hypothetical protein
MKPVPIKFYLKAVLVNKIKDIMTQIDKSYKGFGFITSTDDLNMDIGVEDDLTIIDFKKRIVILRDVDVLEGLNSKEKSCFCLFLKGYEANKLYRMFKPHFDARSLIKSQLQRLEPFKEGIIADKHELKVRFEFKDN